MKVTMNEEDEKVREAFIYDCQGQCDNKPYRRTIARETNQEGKWNRLIKELEEMAQHYGIDFDEALTIFESVSCSKKHFRMILEKKSYTAWTDLEDVMINNIDSPEYLHILKEKGIEEVERRKRFLGLDTPSSS